MATGSWLADTQLMTLIKTICRLGSPNSMKNPSQAQTVSYQFHVFWGKILRIFVEKWKKRRYSGTFSRCSSTVSVSAIAAALIYTTGVQREGQTTFLPRWHLLDIGQMKRRGHDFHQGRPWHETSGAVNPPLSLICRLLLLLSVRWPPDECEALLFISIQLDSVLLVS